MGTMRERSTGVWQLRVSAGFDPVTGGRRIITETFRGSERAASLRLAALETDTARLGAPARITLTSAIDAWRAQATHAAGTAANYDLAVATLPAKVAGLEVAKVTASVITELVALVEREHGISRARLVFACVSGALTHAWRQDWIPSNPARKVKPPAPTRRKATDPTVTEVRRLLAAVAHDPELDAWLRLAASLGARRQEVLALRWSHIDLDRGDVNVRTSLDPITNLPKDSVKAGGERTVAIGPGTVTALRVWRRAFLERALAVGETPVADPFVFTRSIDGSEPWRLDLGTKRFAKARDYAARLDDTCNLLDADAPDRPIAARLHDLRHYVATALLDAGVPVRAVAERLGHSRVATTTDLYGHAIPATDRGAADLLEERLG